MALSIDEKRKLHTALERTNISLRRTLGTPKIKIILVNPEDLQNAGTLQDYETTWKKSSFGWGKRLLKAPIIKEDFTLALYFENHLAGLCALNTEDRPSKPSTLRITDIEKRSIYSPLEGFTSSAFCEAALHIAKEFGIDKTAVDKPVSGTERAYGRVGYEDTSEMSHKEWSMTVTPDSQLTWDIAIAYQRLKNANLPVFA